MLVWVDKIRNKHNANMQNAESMQMLPHEKQYLEGKTNFDTVSINLDDTTCLLFCPEDGTNYQEMLLEMTGQKTVPNVFINKTHLGGCDKTMQVRMCVLYRSSFVAPTAFVAV